MFGSFFAAAATCAGALGKGTEALREEERACEGHSGAFANPKLRTCGPVPVPVFFDM
jgi:hypothetical protein